MASTGIGFDLPYDTAGQIADIFDGMGNGTLGEGDASNGQGCTVAVIDPASGEERVESSLAAPNETETPALAPAAPGDSGGSSEAVSDSVQSMAEVLADTLRAANAPPDNLVRGSWWDSPRREPDDDREQPGGEPFRGVRLNGIPLDALGPEGARVDTDREQELLQLSAGDVLSGSGTVNRAIFVNGTIAPGNSPGLLQTGSQTWLAGGFPYDWEISDVGGGEGNNPGWDFQRVTGTVTMVSTPAAPATVRVKSLLPSNAPGNVFNFNPASAYTWRILSSTGGITGFNPAVVSLDTTSFTNPFGAGAFSLDLSADGRDLLVRFVPSTPAVTFNPPAWTPQGPSYITGNDNSILPPDNPAGGAVQAIAVHPTNPNVAWLGSVNGGIWMTTNLQWSRTNGINDDNLGGVDDALETPSWTPLGQNLPSLGIANLAVSPFDASNAAVTNNTSLNQIILYASTGTFSSSARGGTAAGLFRSMDGGASWLEVGNFAGQRATAIVPSTQTPGLLFVGTYEIWPSSGFVTGLGGVYRSLDQGDTWTRLSGTGGLPEFHVTDLVQEPGNAGRFYVALAGETAGLNPADIGVYRTDNGNAGAVTWIKVDTGIAPDYDHDGIPGESQIAEDRNGNNTKDPGEDTNNNGVLDLGEDANNNGMLDEGEIELDTVAGLSVISQPENLALAVRIRLSVSRATGNAVYAAVISDLDWRLAGVFRSANAGAIWVKLGSEPRTNGGQGDRHFGLVADPVDNTVVYIAGDFSIEDPFDGLVFRWDPGPAEWRWISARGFGDTGTYGATAPHADIRNLVFDAGNNGFMAATDGGVYRLQNPRIGGGTSWEFIGRGVDVAEISSIAYDRNTNTVLMGVQDNGVLTQNQGSMNARGLLVGDGNFVGVAYANPLSPNPLLSTRFYMGNNFNSFYRQVFGSVDVSLGWSQILLQAPYNFTALSGLDDTWELDGWTDRTFSRFQYLPFAVNAADDLSDGQVRLLLGRRGLYTSDDTGDHIVLAPGWDFESQIGYVTALAYGGRANGIARQDVMYVARGNQAQFLFSADNGGSFQTVDPGGAGLVNQISMDPENWRTAFAVDDSTVWLLTVAPDGTLDATDITGNLNDFTGGFQSVEAANLNGQLVVLVGARDGVYRLGVGDVAGLESDPATHARWSRFGVGLPNAQIADLQFDPIDNVLVAGTRGRGAWLLSNAAAALLAEPVLRFDGGPGSEQVRLVLAPATAASPRTLEVYNNAVLVGSYPLSNVLKVSVRLGAGTDTLIVDGAQGDVLIPRGIDYDGGLGTDALDFQGPTTSTLETTVQGAVTLRELGRQIVRSTNVEGLNDNSVLDGFLSSVRKAFQAVSDWFSRADDLGQMPLVGDSLGGGLEGGRFRPLVAVSDKARGPLGEASALGPVRDRLNSFLTRLLQNGPGGFRIADIGTLIVNAVNLQSRLDALDNIANNVTVDNGEQTIALGDLANPAKPFRRTLTFNAPIDATLLGGAIQLHGNLDLSAQIDLMMEMGVDARGFYLGTNASAQPEIVIRNLVVNGKVVAAGKFGILNVNLDNATLTLDPDVQIAIDLVEPADPYGYAPDNKLRLYEFFSNPSGIIAVNVTGDPLQDDLRLDGNFTVSLTQRGAPAFLNLGTVTLGLIWEDINDLGSLRIDATASPQAGFLMQFLNLDRDELLSELERLLDALGSLGDSRLFNVKLPFGSGYKVGDLLDLSEAFLQRVHERLLDINLTGSTNTASGNIQLGQLSANMVFEVILDGVTSPTITVTAASTANNRSMNDLAEDINAALPPSVATKLRAETIRGNIRFRILDVPAPVKSIKITSASPNDPIKTQLGFGEQQPGTSRLKVPSLQSLMRRLGGFLPPLNVAFNQLTQRLTWQIQFIHTFAPEATPFGYDTSYPLGALAEAGFSGTLTVSGGVNLSLTLGLDFGSGTAPQLSGSAFVPPPSNGQLTSAASFSIVINSSVRYAITVTTAETSGFTQLSDLIDLLNSKLIPYSFNTGMGVIPLNQAIRFIQARNPDNSLAPGIHLDALNEDVDADGQLDVDEDLNNNGRLDSGEDLDNDRHLDVAEDLVYQNVDPNFVNGTLNSLLDTVKSLEIQADPDDPIFNEVGFVAGAHARSKVKGLFVDNVSFAGNATVTATNLTATARLGLFGLTTSGGTATGTANIAFTLINPAGGNRIRIGQLLGDLFHLGEYIGPNPVWSFSLDFRLKNIVVTPNIFGSLIPAGAEVRLFIPDLRETAYNPSPYHPVTNNLGLFVTYPQFGPLSNFNCLNVTDLIVALRSLSTQLRQFKSFDFLNRPLPLVNLSIGQIMDFSGNLAQAVQALSTGDGPTLDVLEASLEALLGIPSGDLDFAVEHASVQALVTGATGVAAEYRFNPAGRNNALRFVSLAPTGASYNGVTFQFVDDGTLTPGADLAVVADYDPASKLVAIRYNATYTTAATIRAAVNAKFIANSTTMPFDAVLDAVDPGNDGSGPVHQTAMTMTLSYRVSYANSLPFTLALGDLVDLLPLNSPVRALLAGAADLVSVAGSGNLDVNASADLRLAFGIDVSNPCGWKPFLRDSDYNGPNTGTTITLTAAARATNLNFTAGLGGITISVKNGTATIDADGLINSPGGDADASFVVTLQDANGDGRHYLRSSETFFNSSNLGLTLTAGASAVLPLYALGGTIALGGTGDANVDGYPDNTLGVFIPSLKRLFTPEKTDALNQALLTSPGLNNDLVFTAPGPGREVKIIDVPGAPSVALNGTRLEVSVKSLITAASQIMTGTLAAQIAGLGWSVGPSGPDGITGSGRVYADLTIVTPDLAGLFNGFDPCDLVTNASMLLDGLDGLLGTIQDGLANNVLNQVLPMVGNRLGNAANFIGRFRAGLLAEIRTKLTQAGDPIALVRQALFKSLGADGLDWLVESDGSPINTADDIEIECENNALQFKVRLMKSLAVVDTSANPIQFDIGLPGLGLSVQGNVRVQIGFDLKLYFGLSASDGFYFNTSADEELRLDFKVTIPGLSARGNLLWLQLDVADDPDDPSSFAGYFTVDVRGPGSHPGKLRFTDFNASTFSFSDAFSAQLGAVADVNLDLAVSFQGDAAFPKLLAEFHLDWEWILGGDPGGALEMGFHDVRLDAGAFISKFIKPILDKVRVVTEPLQPVIDVLTTPIPILSKLAGEPIDMLKLAGWFGLIKPGTEEFIRDVVDIVNLINDTSYSDDGSVLIPLGEFNLQADGLGNIERKASDEDPEPQELSSGTEDAGTKGFLARLEEMGFRFPFLKIGEVFKLFTGQPVTLVEYHMPVLEFDFRYKQKVPVYVPLFAVFGGEATVRIELAFGFDTFGLTKYFNSPERRVRDILDGLFVKDVNDDGADIPEVVMSGGLFAGVELSFAVLEAGVTGGLYADLNFNLNDPDDDGKVRLSELIANARISPLCIFDIHGELYVEFTAYLKLATFEKEWDFGKIPLFEFDLDCPTPVLADVSGSGDLTLHMGPRAGDRLEGNIEDGDESFVVRHIAGSGTNADPETVEVSFDGIKQVYKGVKQIFVDGGEGNDLIDLRGVRSPATVNGGNGNDVLWAGRAGRLPGVDQVAGSVYRGDAGNDRITAALRKDVGVDVDDEFYGDGGNDVLLGYEGDDRLFGGTGNDVISGHGGDDQIDGSDGADTITGDAGNDQIDAGSGNDRITSGAGNDVVFAGDGADTVDTGDGNDWVDGGPGADVINVGNGNDWVDAGPGNDRITGGRGDDQLMGGAHNDVINAGPGNDLVIGDVGTSGALPGAVLVFPVAVTGLSGDGNDTLIGGAGLDVIFGVGGNDRIFGGALVTSGQNQVSGSNPSEYIDGADFIDAGRDADIVFADDAFGPDGPSHPGAAIRGAAWFDAADVYAMVNNVRDPGENGVAGVTVELHRTNASIVGTTTTDADGKFVFAGLEPGDYYLVFSLPAGLIFALPNVGGDDTVDSDVNGLGQTPLIHVDEGEDNFTAAAGYQGTTPLIGIDSQTVIEGTGGQTDMVFTVTLSNPSSFLVMVCYASASGIGTRAADRILDFASVKGTLVFQPGETAKTVRITIAGDTVYEGDYETFSVGLETPTGALIDPLHQEGTGMILDDDTAPVVSAVDARTAEGGTLVFTLRLSNASKFPVSVEYLTSQAVNLNGTLVYNGAVPGVDYVNTYEQTAGVAFISPGQLEVTVGIGTLLDDLDEYDEVMRLNIELDPTLPGNYATLGRRVANGFVLDDDDMPYVQVGPITQTIVEGHAGLTPVPLTLSLRDPVTNLPTVSGRPVRVTWNTTTGTARVIPTPADTVDARDEMDTVTFAPQTNTYPGDSFRNITVNIIGDTRTEPQVNGLWEYFFVNLISAENGVLDARDDNLNHATIFVKDDEVPDPGPWYVQFSSTSYSVREGQPLTVTLVAGENSAVPLAVYWSIGGIGPGIASPGADYAGVWEGGVGGQRRFVRFAPGQTTLTFTIPTTQDQVYEGDEVFQLFLANPNGGAVRAPNQIATVTIVEDDPVPSLKINDVTGPEDGGPLHFTVTATGISVVPFTVNWQAFNGTAKAPGDFSPASGSFVIPAFNGFYVVNLISDPVGHPQVTLINDSAPELSENFYVRLSLAVPDTGTIVDYEGKGTILDNDPITVHGFVFMDVNGNGAFEPAGDYALSGVQVTITDANGNHVTTTGPTLTDPNGPYNYALTVLLGTSQVSVALNTAPANSITTTGSVPFAFLFSPLVINAPDIGFHVPIDETETPGAGTVLEGGGANNDTVYGGQGNDEIRGGGGDDWLIGGHWLGPFNACSPAPYDVTVRDNQGRRFHDPTQPSPRGPARAAAAGDAGLIALANEEEEPCPDDDVLYGSDGEDLILGDYGYVTGAGTPVLLGGDGNDRLFGGAGDDRQYGQGGDDQLPGGAGNDFMDGGLGNDLYVYDGDMNNGADTLVELAFGGDDTIDLSTTSGWSVTFDLSIVGAQTVTPLLNVILPAGSVIENVIGGSRDDTLIGNAASNRLEGRNGNDVLIGRAGTNVLVGGLGSDRYLYNADGLNGHDDLIEVASLATAGDIDIIDFGNTNTQGVSLNLGAVLNQAVTPFFSILVSDPLGFEHLYGGNAADVLLGNGRDNVIWGRAGGDFLDGDANGATGDTLREERGSGFNLTNTTLTVTLTGEVDVYANFENVRLVGDDTPNILDASPFTGTVYLEGRGGNDTLRGGMGINYLTGGAGDDLIHAGPGFDVVIEARDANFTVTNGGLALTLVPSGSETDTFNTSNGTIERVELTGDSSNNTLNAAAFSGTALLRGGAGNDTLIGTVNDDTLIGDGGNDVLQGGSGDDVYVFKADAALGADTIVESPGGGIDTLDFTLTISVGVTVNLGDSSVLAFTPTQVINGNLTLTLPADVLENILGGQADDVLIGNVLGNLLIGGAGHDQLTGGLGNDVLDGSAGLHPITAQPYQDRIVETRDDDIFLTNTSLAFGGGDNDILISIEAATLTGGVGDNTINAVAFSGPVFLAGEAGDDVLIGGSAGDVLIGGAGNDLLAGTLDDDRYVFDLDANLDNDVVNEAPGPIGGVDTLDFSATTTTSVSVDLSLAVFQLTNANLGLTLSAGNVIENAIGGRRDDTLIGNGLANVLTGNRGNDDLEGLGDDDTLMGGAGDDTYRFDADNALGLDTIRESADNGGMDTLDFSATSIGISVGLGLGGDLPQVVAAGNLQLLLLSCTVIENAIGGAGDDFIAGNALDNRIEGGPGDDLLAGLEGNDTYVFDTDVPLGGDVLIENADHEGGRDTLDLSGTTTQTITVDLALPLQTVNPNLSLILVGVFYPPIPSPDALENVIGGSLADSLAGNALDNLLVGGPDMDGLIGGDGNDTLLGEAGDDFLMGGSGYDRLIGGADNDLLIGGLGNDTYVFDADTPLTSGLGNDLVLELANEGADTLDFSATTTLGLTIGLGLAGTQNANANLTLALSGNNVVENVVGGTQDDVLEGNTLDNRLQGGRGNDTYRFDADAPLGVDTLIETPGLPGAGGIDTLDFAQTSALQIAIVLSLSVRQTVNANLRLVLGSGTAFENAIGGALNNVITGNALDNRLESGPGNDTLVGLGGDDVFVVPQFGSLHAVTLVGGGGHDTLDLSGFSLGATVNLATTGSAQTVAAGELQLTLPQLDFEGVIGGSGSDQLTGNALANRLEGGGGNDQLTGGAGDDLYVFDADAALGTDTVIEDASPAGGLDTLEFSETTAQNISVDLSDHSVTPQNVNGNLSLLLPGTDLVENLVGGGQDNTLTGNSLNNRIVANGDDNALSGGAGDDTFVFNLDVITGSVSLAEVAGGINTLDFSPTQTQQVLFDLAVNDPLNLITRVIGGAADDVITGNALNNTLMGGGGNDVLLGGAGNDTLRGDDGDDALDGGANDDTLVGGTGNDVLTGGSGNDLYAYNLPLAVTTNLVLGQDTIVELAAGGTDSIVGIPPFGVVNLAAAGPQAFFNGAFRWILSLILANPGQVEIAT